MRRKMMNYLATILTETGIPVRRGKEHDHKTWRLVSGFVYLSVGLISTTLYSIVNFDDFDKFVAPIIYITAIASILFNLVIIFRCRRAISETLYQMDDNCYTYPDEHALDIRYKWYLKEKNIIFVMTAILVSQYLAVVSMILPSVVELITNGKISVYLYPAWTPWKTDDPKFQLLTLIIQIFHGIDGIWFLYIVMATIFMIVLEFQRQFERLRGAIASLKRRSLSLLQLHEEFGDRCFTIRKPPDRSFDEIIRMNIVHCIKHHQMLYKNFHVFRIWFSVLFSVELGISVFSFSFGVYILTNASNISTLVIFFGATTIVSTNFLSRCFLGEVVSGLDSDTKVSILVGATTITIYILGATSTLEDQGATKYRNWNDKLRDTLFFELEWYKWNDENRQLIVMFHFMLSRPFRLLGFSVFSASRDTFAKVMRHTYAAFNVINASLKK